MIADEQHGHEGEEADPHDSTALVTLSTYATDELPSLENRTAGSVMDSPS